MNLIIDFPFTCKTYGHSGLMSCVGFLIFVLEKCLLWEILVDVTFMKEFVIHSLNPNKQEVLYGNWKLLNQLLWYRKGNRPIIVFSSQY